MLASDAASCPRDDCDPALTQTAHVMLLPTITLALCAFSLFRAAIPRKMGRSRPRPAWRPIHELRRAVRGPEGDRLEPGGGGALLRHVAGPAWRQRHQGRADRRRRLGTNTWQALR